MKHFLRFRQYILPAIFLLAMTGIFSREIKAECTGDGSAQFKQAVESLASAEEVVFGGARTSLLAGWCGVYENWIKTMQKPPYAMQKEYGEGLTFPQAVNFLKKYIAQPENGQGRVNIINSAVYEVYGRPSTAVEQGNWDALLRTQKATFMTILSGEITNLNDPNSGKNLLTGREPMIERAFLSSYGRFPDFAEVKELRSRPDHYKRIIEANRNYLYSAKGAEEYVKTLKKMLIYQYQIAKTKTIPAGAKPSFLDDEAKKLMPYYTEKKWIFSQMLGEYDFEKYLASMQKAEQLTPIKSK